MVYTFAEPFIFEAETITELDLSGMKDLTGQDLVDAQHKLSGESFANVPVDSDIDFLVWLLQKGTQKPLEFFWALPDLEWNTLQEAALRAMMDAGEEPEKLEEECYTTRAMAKVQKALTFADNMIRMPSNNIRHCLTVYAVLTSTPLASLLAQRAGTAMMIFLQVRRHFFGLGRLAATKSQKSSGDAVST